MCYFKLYGIFNRHHRTNYNMTKIRTEISSVLRTNSGCMHEIYGPILYMALLQTLTSDDITTHISVQEKV